MKVHFEWPYKTYSGSVDGTTFMSHRKEELCLARINKALGNMPEERKLSKAAQNLKSIWDNANPAYKADVKKYAGLYKKSRLNSGIFPAGAYAIFVRIMYIYKKTNPEQIELSTLTIADITSINAPVRSVAETVRAQLLPPVKDWETMINLI